MPLLCVSALDDPVCTREAIPWDECRWSCSSHVIKHMLYLDDFFFCLIISDSWTGISSVIGQIKMLS